MYGTYRQESVGETIVIDPEELARIEEYCNNATAGPWRQADGWKGDFGIIWAGPGRRTVARVQAGLKSGQSRGEKRGLLKKNMTFIANSRIDLPLLISSLREAQERIGKLEETLKSLSYEPDDTIDPLELINRVRGIARAALESK